LNTPLLAAEILYSHGQAHYDASILDEDWPEQNATLAWKRQGSACVPRILHRAPMEELSRFEGALGGVRVLIEGGRAASLAPGMGGSTLRCSRTSVAWKRGAGALWILSVRDPDGEASSVHDNALEKSSRRLGLPLSVQRGGWDVGQVQAFWRARGMSDAVLFDGGESGQIAGRQGGRWSWSHSSYHLSRTLGFVRGRPLRMVLPMLPPTLANGGVLNWFFVRARGNRA